MIQLKSTTNICFHTHCDLITVIFFPLYYPNGSSAGKNGRMMKKLSYLETAWSPKVLLLLFLSPLNFLCEQSSAENWQNKVKTMRFLKMIFQDLPLNHLSR